MTDTPRTPAPDPELAAELALGLIDGDERVQAERWRMSDPAFAREVAAWESHFALLAEDIEPVEPRGRVKARLDRALFDGSPSRRSRPSRQRRRRTPGWLDGLWTGTLGGGIVAGLLVFALLGSPWAPPGVDTPIAPPTAVAELISDSSGFRAYALLTDDGAQVVYGIAEGQAPAGRVLQLWGVRGNSGPVSLGVIEGREGVATLPNALRLASGQLTLEISEEPPGGSPQAGPTGSVLGIGQAIEF